MDDLDTRLLVDLLRDRIRPSKELGQHFLIDDSVISRSVSLASSKALLGEDSHVIEIGPGPGSLTLALLRAGTSVTAFEIDEEAVSHLQRVFGDADGRLVGEFVGDEVVGDLVVGDEVGEFVGGSVGTLVGDLVGDAVG